MKLYRACSYKYMHDLSGGGARINGGRWNSEGKPALYTSESKSLAILEVLANTPLAILGANYMIMTLQVADNVSIEEFAITNLPLGWNTYPVPVFVTQLGDKWLTECKSLLLKVPSVIVPSEYNVIINPLYADMNKVKLIATEKLVLDKRIEENL